MFVCILRLNVEGKLHYFSNNFFLQCKKLSSDIDPGEMEGEVSSEGSEPEEPDGTELNKVCCTLYFIDYVLSIKVIRS